MHFSYLFICFRCISKRNRIRLGCGKVSTLRAVAASIWRRMRAACSFFLLLCCAAAAARNIHSHLCWVPLLFCGCVHVNVCVFACEGPALRHQQNYQRNAASIAGAWVKESKERQGAANRERACGRMSVNLSAIARERVVRAFCHSCEGYWKHLLLLLALPSLLARCCLGLFLFLLLLRFSYTIFM